MSKYQIVLLLSITFLVNACSPTTKISQLTAKSVNLSQIPRLALVIGNAEYSNDRLTKTVNDANDMAQMLKTFGFDVLLYTNTDKRTMKEAIRIFGQRLLQKNGVGLFYYSGHGIQFQNQNYLIPIQADVTNEADIEYETIAANYVVSQMELANNTLNIVILDACRNNPFARSFTRSMKNGLSEMNAPGAQYGGLIAFATGPVKVAFEGDGRNGIFTKHLLNVLRSNSQKGITEIFLDINKSVQQETEGRQASWVHYSLTQQFCFAKCSNLGSNPESNPPSLPSPPSLPLNCLDVKIGGNTIDKWYPVEANGWKKWTSIQELIRQAKKYKAEEAILYQVKEAAVSDTIFRLQNNSALFSL